MNNHADNLAWGTPQENAADKILHGTATGFNLERNKLTAENVVDILKRLKDGTPGSVLADEYGVTRPMISHIKTGRYWRYVNVD